VEPVIAEAGCVADGVHALYEVAGIGAASGVRIVKHSGNRLPINADKVTGDSANSRGYPSAMVRMACVPARTRRDLVCDGSS
jgi:hypothetical protein